MSVDWAGRAHLQFPFLSPHACGPICILGRCNTHGLDIQNVTTTMANAINATGHPLWCATKHFVRNMLLVAVVVVVLD